MREIKFRVWDKLGKKYIYPCRDYHFVINLNGKFQNFQNGSGGDEYEIQQFTGLKDVNGIDIYEGDIILETWEENQPYGYDPYEWYSQTSKFAVEYKAPSFNFPKRYGDQRSIENYELKVIGNIFEDKNETN